MARKGFEQQGPLPTLSHLNCHKVTHLLVACRSSSDGYAIAINRAVSLAKQIRAGRMTETVHVGGTPFLGVQIRDLDQTVIGNPAHDPARRLIRLRSDSNEGTRCARIT